ncbi:hypothetical protein HQ590_02300 [bacterium]|nr:hypothetical protein [bacterium]
MKGRGELLGLAKEQYAFQATALARCERDLTTAREQLAEAQAQNIKLDSKALVDGHDAATWRGRSRVYHDGLMAARKQLAEVQEHLDRLTGMKFSERMHAALVNRAQIAEAARDTYLKMYEDERDNLAEARADERSKALVDGHTIQEWHQAGVMVGILSVLLLLAYWLGGLP